MKTLQFPELSVLFGVQNWGKGVVSPPSSTRETLKWDVQRNHLGRPSPEALNQILWGVAWELEFLTNNPGDTDVDYWRSTLRNLASSSVLEHGKQVGTSMGLFLSQASPDTSLWHEFDPVVKFHEFFHDFLMGSGCPKGVHMQIIKGIREKNKAKGGENCYSKNAGATVWSLDYMSHLFIHYLLRAYYGSDTGTGTCTTTE